MTLSSIDLWQRISSEGLADEATCRNWAAEAVRAMPSGDALDGEQLLEKLIELKKISRFQANVLLGKAQDCLKKGHYVILRPDPHVVFFGWYEAIHSAANADQGDVVWARWLDEEDMTSLRRSAPSLKRAGHLSEITVPHLQPIFSPEFEDRPAGRELLLRVGPLAGECLSLQFATDPPPREIALRILAQTTEALAGLHKQKVTHGRVFPDRIFWDGAKATLACDPLCQQTGAADQQAHGLFADDLQHLSNFQFLAPEFMAPGQTPNFQTDVYALGCTCWWLITGQPVADGADDAEIMKQQASSQLRKKTEVPLHNAWRNVLEHMLSPDPKNRFADAVQVRRAIQACLSGSARISSRRLSSSVGLQEKPAITDSPRRARKALRKQSSSIDAIAPAAAPDRAKQKPKPSAANNESSTETAIEIDSRYSAEQAPPSVTKPSAASESPKKLRSAANTVDIPVQPRAAEKLAANATGKAPAKEKHPANRDLSKVEPAKSEPTAAGRPRDKPVSIDHRTASSSEPSLQTHTVRGANSRRRRSRQRRSNNKWLIPVVGGCGFLIFLLLMLKFSGVLDADRSETQTATRPSYVPPVPPRAEDASETDPRLAFFNVVQTADGELWLPPHPPSPLELRLLPPGAGLYLSLDSPIFSEPDLAAFIDTQEILGSIAGGRKLSNLLQELAINPENGFELTASFYAPAQAEDFPQIVIKVELENGIPAASLQESLSVEPSGDDQNHWMGDGYSIYVVESSSSEQPSETRVAAFSIGTPERIAEAQELKGAAPPLLPAVQRLLQWTDSEADVNLLVVPSFLFSEGRGIWKSMPSRLKEIITEWMERDVVASSLQMNFSDRWFVEWRIATSSSPAAGRLASDLRTRLSRLADDVEAWLVATPAHSSWRALAIRFPQMLRVLENYTRIGIEDSVLIANAYLPPDAAPNLLLASWLSLQPTSTVASSIDAAATSSVGGNSNVAIDWTIEDFLKRNISLRFDQEPIEEAFRLIALEANDDLPAGVETVEFVLDGDAFELAGITRNQQLRDFSIEQRPVREALTELAKQGNPVTTVTDTREKDQKLIWVVKSKPDSPDRQQISLTTREAAGKQELPLPPEFAADRSPD